jgi:hypothetical protein
LTSDIRENERPSHETYCDLIERELQKALEDIAFIRVSEAKGRYQFFKGAIGTIRHFLWELELSLPP